MGPRTASLLGSGPLVAQYLWAGEADLDISFVDLSANQPIASLQDERLDKEGFASI